MTHPPTPDTLDDRELLGLARDVLRMEAEAVAALADRVGEPFTGACRPVGLTPWTGGPRSTLAQHSELVLDISVSREACPHNLAPTSSTTAALALGDALALAVMRARRFTPEQFALFHPAGALGRRLLL